MPGKADIVHQAEELLEDRLRQMGYELVAVEWIVLEGRQTLRIFIDREGGVDIADCVRVNDTIGDLLDVEDFIQQRYHLEVSSPGLDRPLRKPVDFERFLGERVKIRTYEAQDGRRNYQGTLEAVDDGIVTVRVDNEPHRIPIAAMMRANLIYDHNKDLRR